MINCLTSHRYPQFANSKLIIKLSSESFRYVNVTTLSYYSTCYCHSSCRALYKVYMIKLLYWINCAMSDEKGETWSASKMSQVRTRPESLVADCSTPALQPPERRGRQGYPDESTAHAESWCRQSGDRNERRSQCSDQCQQSMLTERPSHATDLVQCCKTCSDGVGDLCSHSHVSIDVDTKIPGLVTGDTKASPTRTGQSGSGVDVVTMRTRGVQSWLDLAAAGLPSSTPKPRSLQTDTCCVRLPVRRLTVTVNLGVVFIHMRYTGFR